MPAFTVFGFASQVLLLGFFAAHLWRPADEARLGRLVYGMGLVALLLGAAFVAQGQPWYLVLAFALYAAWSTLGALVDIVRPIAWREPPRLSILVPYAALLTAALLAFWMPLRWVDQRLWIAFGLLYAAHTTLNLASHRAARTST
jgi:hypothetical protein